MASSAQVWEGQGHGSVPVYGNTGEANPITQKANNGISKLQHMIIDETKMFIIINPFKNFGVNSLFSLPVCLIS